jgi:trk system potassium uptake protein
MSLENILFVNAREVDMVIVIGCGRMGSGLAKALSLRGQHVTVIDKEKIAFEKLSGHLNVRTVLGVGFDRDVLRQAGIEKAEGLVAVTSSDEANIVATQLAGRIFHVPKVIARVYDPRKAEIYKRLGLATISTTSWGTEHIIQMLTRTALEGTPLGSNLELTHYEVSPNLAGRTVQAITLPGELHVVAIERDGKSFLATDSSTLQTGDTLHLAVLTSASDKVASLLP